MKAKDAKSLLGAVTLVLPPLVDPQTKLQDWELPDIYFQPGDKETSCHLDPAGETVSDAAWGISETARTLAQCEFEKEENN